MKQRIGLLYCLLAGAVDLCTGLLLMMAPRWTLKLMLISDVLAQPVYIRFVGAFVASLGALYLHAALRRDERRLRLIYTMEATALVRLGIALFVGTALLSGALSPMWVSVFLTDASLAAAQVLMLKRGVFDHVD